MKSMQPTICMAAPIWHEIDAISQFYGDSKFMLARWDWARATTATRHPVQFSSSLYGNWVTDYSFAFPTRRHLECRMFYMFEQWFDCSNSLSGKSSGNVDIILFSYTRWFTIGNVHSSFYIHSHLRAESKFHSWYFPIMSTLVQTLPHCSRMLT